MHFEHMVTRTMARLVRYLCFSVLWEKILLGLPPGDFPLWF